MKLGLRMVPGESLGSPAPGFDSRQLQPYHDYNNDPVEGLSPPA
jgi:hypothetical protein